MCYVIISFAFFIVCNFNKSLLQKFQLISLRFLNNRGGQSLLSILEYRYRLAENDRQRFTREGSGMVEQ